MVPDCTGWLKVAVAVDDTATLVAPDKGVSLVTIGADAAAVVKDQLKGDVMATPELFRTPLTVAVYVVE
jgi:hypothetical protein